MAGFDPTLDKTIKEEVIDFPDRNTKLKVSIKQYNDGMKKLQISRANVRDGEEVFSKLGRLVKDETKLVAEAMLKLVDEVDQP